MPAMREPCTDERLDDLNQRVTEGVTRIDHELRELRRELNRGLLTITGLMLTGFLTIAGLMAG